MKREVLNGKCMAYYHQHSWLYLNLQFQKNKPQMYMLKNNEPSKEPSGTTQKMSSKLFT